MPSHFFERCELSKLTHITSYEFWSKTAIVSNVEGINFKNFLIGTNHGGAVNCLKIFGPVTFIIAAQALFLWKISRSLSTNPIKFLFQT